MKLYGFWRSLATYRARVRGLSLIAATPYFNCDVSGVPTALRIYGECMKLDAFAKAHPSKQAEAPESLVTP